MSGLSFSVNVPQPDLGAVASGISNQITDKQQEQISGSNTNGAVVATIKTFADLDQVNAKRAELAALRSDLKTEQTSLSALQTQWAAAEAAHPDFTEKLAAAGGDVAGLPTNYKEAGTLWSQLQAVKTAVDGISAQVSGTEAALVAMGIDVGSPETDVRSAGDKAIDTNARNLATLIKSQTTLQTELDGLKASGSDAQRQAQVESQLNGVKGQINDELQSLGLAATAAPTTLGGKTLAQIQQEAKQQALTDKSNASPEAQRARGRALNQEAAALRGEMKDIVTKGYTSNAERARYQVISSELLPAILADIASQPQQSALHASRQQVNDLLNKATDLASASPLLGQREAIDAQLAGLQRPVQAPTARPPTAASTAHGTERPTGTGGTGGTERPAGTSGTTGTTNTPVDLPPPPAKPAWMAGSAEDLSTPYGKAVSNWAAAKTELLEITLQLGTKKADGTTDKRGTIAAQLDKLTTQIKSMETSDKRVMLDEQANYLEAKRQISYLQALAKPLEDKQKLLTGQVADMERALLTSVSETDYNNQLAGTVGRASQLNAQELVLLKLAQKEANSAYDLRSKQAVDYQMLQRGQYYDDNGEIQALGSSGPINANFRTGRRNINSERKALGYDSRSQVITHWRDLATQALPKLTLQTAVLLADKDLAAAKVNAQAKRVEINALAASGKSTAAAEKALADLEKKVTTAQTAYSAALAEYNAKLAETANPKS